MRNDELVSKKNILFVSLVILKNLEKRGIYPDLINHFIAQGHHVTVLSPVERREKNAGEIVYGKGYTNIRYKTLNNTKTNYVEKLISTLVIDVLLKNAIKKHVVSPIDILVCATPPITLTSTIRFVKKRFNVPCYLLLKDIFPDNVADLELIKRSSFIYKLFRRKEKRLYELADYIGCMSPANVKYLMQHNPEISASKVEVNPNTINPILPQLDALKKEYLRKKYKVLDKSLVFFYGGNLGKPQMISFLIEMIESNMDNPLVHFFIIGNGTDFSKIQKWNQRFICKNLTLLSFVPKAEYDDLINIADIGIVLLDNRFKIPNFPNRILSYMENNLPVLLATDVNTDIGQMAVDNGFGLWAESGNLKDVNAIISEFVSMPSSKLKTMGLNGNKLLKADFSVERSYELIISKIKH